ncbi:selenium-dependent molybdenum cofactor biosynthesis protein YqeB [Chloroflexota bacterium]
MIVGDSQKRDVVLIRGGGDLASGVALRLHRSGMHVIITELDQPLVIRRSVSFAEAIYQGETHVEGITARKVDGMTDIQCAWDERVIPVLVDPECSIINQLETNRPPWFISVLVDGRMTKRPPELGMDSAPMVVGLGPGFIAGDNCHAVIETNRGHFLGKVIWNGSASGNTGVPGGFGGEYHDRVLRSPADGLFQPERQICDRLNQGDKIAEVGGESIYAPFKGVLRGILYPGLFVQQGFKIGDLDHRDDPRYCITVSDKSLAVAGGVLEAILTNKHQREILGE